MYSFIVSKDLFKYTRTCIKQNGKVQWVSFKSIKVVFFWSTHRLIDYFSQPYCVPDSTTVSFCHSASLSPLKKHVHKSISYAQTQMTQARSHAHLGWLSASWCALSSSPQPLLTLTPLWPAEMFWLNLHQISCHRLLTGLLRSYAILATDHSMNLSLSFQTLLSPARAFIFFSR